MKTYPKKTSRSNLFEYARMWSVQVEKGARKAEDVFIFESPFIVPSPAIDVLNGILYWPWKTRLDVGDSLCFLFLHELGHLVASEDLPHRTAELGPICSFEWASCLWLGGEDLMLKWVDWRLESGDSSSRLLLCSAKRYMRLLEHRGLFQRGWPTFYLLGRTVGQGRYSQATKHPVNPVKGWAPSTAAYRLADTISRARGKFWSNP